VSARKPGTAPNQLDLRRLFLRLGASAVLFVLVLFVSMEIALRIGGRYADRLLINTSPGPDGVPVFDPAVGHLLEPRFSGICRRTEFVCPVRSNSLGFRDDEVAEGKAPGEFRIWVLGDSIASGFGVREEDRFTERLETLLNAEGSPAVRLGRRVRVINSAVGGHGTWHEALVLERFIERIVPDEVLLDFSTTNDFINNLEFTKWKNEGGRYYLFPPPEGLLKGFCRDQFHAYHLIGSLLRWESPLGAIESDARATTVAALDRVRDACAARGIPLTVAVMATLNSLEEIDVPGTYQADAYRVALDILREGGYRVVDTVAAFRKRGQYRDLFHAIDRHPNAAGHALLASVIAGADLASSDEAASR